MTLPKQDCVIVGGNKSGHTYVQWLVAVLIATTLLNYGLQCGWISPMEKVLKSDSSPSGTPVTDAEMSWIASSMSLTAVLGTVLYWYLADTYGRKIGVIAMLIPQAMCWILKICSTHVAALIIARIMSGFPAGGCFNLVPMYIKEISQDNIRGILVSLAMTFINIGYLAMYSMGSYLNYYVVLWIAACIPIGAGILLIIIAPESPAFLVKKGKFEEAAKTVARLRGLDVADKIVQNEMDYMRNQEEYYQSIEKISLITIMKNKAWFRGFLMCSIVLTILDLNGSQSINAYALTVMTRAGVLVNPELMTLVIPTIMIFGSIISLTVVERFGRKLILMGGFALTSLADLCLATTLLLQERGDVTLPSWLSILAISVAVWSYAAAVLPMTYVILSEVFNFQIRAKVIGAIVTYAWFVSFVQLYSYHPLTNNFGMHTTFYVYAGVNCAGALFALVFVPETMGKSVEEIEKIFLGKK